VDDLLNDLLGEGEGGDDTLPPAVEASNTQASLGSTGSQEQRTAGFEQDEMQQDGQTAVNASAGGPGGEPDLFAGLGVAEE
jgi:hypothetical protein